MDAKNLPSHMCPGCKFYTYISSNGSPHRCNNSDSFTNFSKVNHDPAKEGPSSNCGQFKPK